jgi:rhodanese-related sulfurtransferase
MPAPDEITPNQLARLIGPPDAPDLIDVRIDEDVDQDPYLVPGAYRAPHTDLPALVTRLAVHKAIVICHKGLKLSQGVAAHLRSLGLQAEFLQGGSVAWARDYPDFRVPLSSLPNGPWVTRHRPKIDRIACPWLIRRFVDRDAQFLFVAPSQVNGVAQHFNATPFDMEGCEWSHRGTACTFDTMCAAWNLQTPALMRLADLIRAADTHRHDLHPAAAGLLAVSVGLSRQYRNDNAQLEAGMHLYDALYRWARDGYKEGHDWPTKGSNGT